MVILPSLNDNYLNLIYIHYSIFDLMTSQFCLSKNYKTEGRHVSLNKNKGVVGTPRFLSLRAHKGYELSRRDDLESMFYVMIQIIKGDLPWRGINIKNKKER